MSWPTVPNMMPSAIIARALSAEPRASAIDTIRPSSTSEKYSAGPNFNATLGQRWGRDGQRDGGDRTREEGPDRGGCQRRPGPALLGHLVTVERGDRRRRLTGQVDQDGRRRAAVLCAVVDAGQHDQSRHRLEVERDRQQQRHRRRRPDAGQHADRRPEQHAQEAVEDVLDQEGGREAQRKVVEKVHASLPWSLPENDGIASTSGCRVRTEPRAPQRDPQLESDDEDERAATVSPAATATAVSGRMRRLASVVRRAVTADVGTNPRRRTANPKNTTASTMTMTARQGIAPNEITSPAMSPLTTTARPSAARITPTSSGK